MGNYQLKEGTFTHIEKGKKLEAGAVVTMTDKRFHSLRDRFELIDEYEEIIIPVPEEVGKDDSEADSDDEDYSDWIKEVSSHPAKQARNTVAVIDEVDVLLALLESETRKTVVEAIENRLEELI